MDKRCIARELAGHFPYSVFFTAAGIVLAAVLGYISVVTLALPVDPHSWHDHDHGHDHLGHSPDGPVPRMRIQAPRRTGERYASAHRVQAPVMAEADGNGHGHGHGHGDCSGHAHGQDHAGHGHDHGHDGHDHRNDHDCDEHGDPFHDDWFEEDEIALYASQMMFHVFHPIHLLLSAMATTAMFFRYDRKVWKAVIVGALGSVLVCGLSDIVLPYLAGSLLNARHMHLHVCIIEHPQMVLPFVALGIVTGLLAATAILNSTVLAHSAHVFVSSAASLFYLVSFGIPDWYAADRLGPVFIIVVCAVTIPCCLSDIVFPVALANAEGRTTCTHHYHHHPGEARGDREPVS